MKRVTTTLILVWILPFALPFTAVSATTSTSSQERAGLSSHSLKILHNGAVIRPRISQGGLYILVSQNLLHTKNGHARIEQHRGTGVTK